MVRAWEQTDASITFRAEGIEEEPVSEEQLELAIERQRFALGIDDDLSEFYEMFKRDPVLGPVIHRRPTIRAKRTVWPWHSLLRAITKQLIESSRAAAIERRIVRRWGIGAAGLLDVPGAEVVREIAPAELVACDLTEASSLAMLRCAREVAAGRADLADPDPTGACWRSARSGRGPSSASGSTAAATPTRCRPAISATSSSSACLAGLGRRATVEEVEEYYAPYEPFRGSPGPSCSTASTRRSPRRRRCSRRLT